MKEWVLTQEAFDNLLVWLDADRERAGDKYEEIRQKLMKFFKWRGCPAAEEYTDITLDRVSKRITEGIETRVADPYLYCHGVAVNVLKEFWKAPERGLEAIEDLPVTQSLSQNPLGSTEQELDAADKERHLQCLEDCLQKLSPENHTLLTEYHQGERRAKIDNRENLAKQLNIPLNALRIRAFRIRSELAKCIIRCVKKKV